MLRKLLLSKTALYGAGLLALEAAFIAPALANPENGQVSSGSATISVEGKKLDIHQQSDRVVIDWRNFDIAADY